MERKRILFCHASAELYGADYVLLQLCRYLKGRGHEPIVVLPFHGSLCQEFDSSGISYHICPLPVLRRRYYTPLGAIQYGAILVYSLWRVGGIARRNRIDLYHTNTAGIWTAGILAKIGRRRHIWQVMEIIEKPRLVSFAIAKVVGMLSTRVFCISEAVRTHLLRQNGSIADRFQTLYHGVDMGEYDRKRSDGGPIRASLGIPDTAIVILYASRFSAWKGQDVLARAIPLVSQGVPPGVDVRFVLLGSCFQGQEQHEEELRRILSGYGEPGRHVYLPGFRKDLPAWMAASDIFVLPSKNPEPNATVLIAAMIMGLPCVGTNLGGTVETIADGQTGLLIPPDDAAALAGAVLQLVLDPARRLAYGAAGRERATRMFSLEQYCRTVEASYA
jgi:glycosyltransferase involved in cell wall biosynthesis